MVRYDKVTVRVLIHFRRRGGLVRYKAVKSCIYVFYHSYGMNLRISTLHLQTYLYIVSSN